MTEINHCFTLDITINSEGKSAIDWISEHCDLSRSAIKEAMSKGAVWLKRGKQAQTIRRGNKLLEPDQRLFVYYNAQVLAQEVSPPRLIHENRHYSVWYKPSGMFSHGSKWGDHCAITRWVEQHHEPQRACFLVHRLDRATQGLILLAHDKKAAHALCQLFEQRSLTKRYLAIVEGEFPTSEILIDQPVDNKTALTRAQAIGYAHDKNISLVDVKIETGRKHQIRQHLAYLNHPIVGDRLYNPRPISEASPDLQLCAYYLAFDCPLLKYTQTFEVDEALKPQLSAISPRLI